MLTKILYRNDICHCDMSSKATTIFVVKTLVMAATSYVFAKLFATALIPTTCNDIFSAAKSIFSSNIVFFSATYDTAKTNFSCSDNCSQEQERL